MGKLSFLKTVLGKTPAAGKRMGDKDNFQKGSKSTSTSAKNTDKKTNRNDYVGGVLDKQAGEDISKMKKILPSKRTDKTGAPLQGAANSAAKDAAVRAASRTATRVAKVSIPVAVVAVATKAKEDKNTGATAKGRRGGVTSPVMAADGRKNKEDYPTYKKGTESSAAFRQSFKKAKDAGATTFTFEGRKYNTKDKK
jgi:hypothetical protein